MAWNDMWKNFSSQMGNQRQQFQNAEVTPEQQLQNEYDQHMEMYNRGVQFLMGKPGAGALIPQINTQHQKWLTDYQNRSGQQQQTAVADAMATQQAGNNTGYDQILAQAQKAYNPANIQNYYNVAQGNLNRQAGNAGALAARTAGAHSTNMLNPAGFIMSQISQSQAPYAAQTGNIQATAAGAQQSGAEGLTNMMLLLQRAKQGDKDAANQLQYNYAALRQNQNQYQQSLANNQYQFNTNQANQMAGAGDYITNLAKLAANLYSSGIFGGGGTDYVKAVNQLNDRGIQWLG